MLNAFPYTSGHLMVAPIRHEAELNGLSPEEGAALFAGLQRATQALRDVSHPDGFNVGANLGREAGAGVPGHLHFHAVPRWGGDTNFMTAVAEVRVIPEDLRTTWEKLQGGVADNEPVTSDDARRRQLPEELDITVARPYKVPDNRKRRIAAWCYVVTPPPAAPARPAPATAGCWPPRSSSPWSPPTTSPPPGR